MALVIALAVNGTFSAHPSRPKVRIERIEIQEPAPGSQVGTQLPDGTTMVALDWSSPETSGAEIRTLSKAGWSDWVEVEANPDEGPDRDSTERGRTFGSPVWIGSDASDVQVRSKAGLGDVAVHAISSPNVDPGASAQATPSEPRIYTRAEWGADESIKTCSPSYASNVRNAFVHHTDTGNDYSADDVTAIIRGIYAYHVFSRGWCDIGYNFLVDKWGRVFEGRYGGMTRAVIGAHAGGFNTGSTGVSVLGNFTATTIPNTALDGVRDLLAWKLTYHRVDAGNQVTATSGGSTRYAEGTQVTLWNISGHRDVSLTACPGDGIYPSLSRLRDAVQKKALSTPPHPLPGWRPPTTGPKLVALDAYGGLHPAGAQPSVTHTAHWDGFRIARGIFYSAPGKGYVMDGWGGLHGFGGNSKPSVPGNYWPGWDIARGIARGPVEGTGYKLDGWGGVHPFGGAPPVSTNGYWHGWDIARGIASDSTGLKGYVLDGWGGLHPFGGATSVTTTAYWGGWDIARGIALRPDGKSGYVLDGWGGIHPFGGAPAVQVTHYSVGRDMHEGIALNERGDGGWVIDTNGEVWPFGNSNGVGLSLSYMHTGLGRGIAVSPPTGTVTT